MVRCGRQDFCVQIIENINLLLRFEKIAINTPSSANSDRSNSNVVYVSVSKVVVPDFERPLLVLFSPSYKFERDVVEEFSVRGLGE